MKLPRRCRPSSRFGRTVATGIGLICLLPTGCANRAKHHNFSHISLDANPLRKSFREPSVDFGRLQKFVLVRLSGTDAGKDINPIEESQLLYVVKNLLLAKGYDCVETRDEADFVVAITYANEYKETFIPPRQITLPQYLPGGTSQTYANFQGYAGNTYVWGSGNATTYHPGTWTTNTYTIGGYNVGFYYPFVAVNVVDANTLGQVWQGSAISSSKTADVRLTGQFLLANLLGNEFPPGTRQPDPDQGILGVSCMSFSRDGNTYFPTVMALMDKGPAKKAGIKQFDQIVSVNGDDVGNTALTEFFERLGKPGDTVSLRIQREDKFVEKTVVLAQRPAAN